MSGGIVTVNVHQTREVFRCWYRQREVPAKGNWPLHRRIRAGEMPSAIFKLEETGMKEISRPKHYKRQSPNSHGMPPSKAHVLIRCGAERDPNQQQGREHQRKG